ncbi:MAG: PilX N-terminal domain-containing pilus assembly protein [Proteobacteria bacterium]|nr:PilX N-terminal domain-containing pilus assembly protein [Pseudomonadota bacterium]
MKYRSSLNRGFTLILALFFLLLITMIGLFLTRSSSLELRMAGNSGAKAQSFERAEEARLDGEATLTDVANKISSGTPYNCADLGKGFHAAPGYGSNCTSVSLAAMKWDGTDSLVDPDNSNARYVYEYLGLDNVTEEGDDVEIGAAGSYLMDVYVFRVIARGLETSGASSTIETIFLAREA